MASIRRTDIMHNKGFPRGRPAKSERERNRKRQEAYRWRDARRIYLANSFDRWRKLRCSLGMKDSVLAWHLMEAHEKGQCGICSRDTDQDDADALPESQTFLPLLIKTVRSLCYSKFQFEECIKVVGLLCLEFDNARKENFSLDETILAKLGSPDAGYSTTSSHTESSSKSIESSDKEKPTVKSSCPGSKSCDSHDANENQTHVLTPVNGDGNEISLSCLISKQTYRGVESEEQRMSPSDTIGHSIERSVIDGGVGVPKLSPHTNLSVIGKSTKDENPSGIIESSSFVESEADISLEIDVERIDTSQEEHSYHQNDVSPVKTKSYNGISFTQNGPPLSQDTSSLFRMKSSKKSPVSSVSNFVSAKSLPNVTEQYSSPTIPELPLDMSIEKTVFDSQRKESVIQKMVSSQSEDLCKELSVDTSYQDLMVKEVEGSPFSDRHQDQAKRAPPMLSQSSGHVKEEIHPSIPWQRRDMSRKEEYEFLEMNPFSDLSEFSQRYPHVHQRTYYRWKRRIKEEYIILEQCPHMTFEQFSSVVLQAKESVFNLWKSFIAQGKGFFAPSDASKRLETKCPTSKTVNTLSDQYSFLQKNLGCTQDQFCQKFSNTSEDVFMALKSKVLQEFWIFYHNQHLDWKEFCKLVDVSEEVYNSWRDHLSKDVKPALSGFSPNAQMISPHCPPFQNACDPQTQLLKPAVPTYDAPLEDPVSRSLSASYLNSVQNMMFPWTSYYGMHGSLNQQMLPMMVWPRVMGMNGGTLNPMSLPSIMSSSPSSCGSKAESPHERNTLTTQSNLQSQPNIPDAKNLKGENIKIYSPSKDVDGDGLHRFKRSSSAIVHEIKTEAEHCKKQRVKEEVENVNAQSPVNKSRKQNKQEYIYYLKNPSLNFKDLETLFPTISLRTFYRWRKEMNAALLFIQERNNIDYQQFKLVFPDIPEDIFEIWSAKLCKENVGKGSMMPQSEYRREENIVHPVKNDEHTPVSLNINEMPQQIVNRFDDFSLKDNIILGESSPAKKQFKAAHIFIHQNPNIDFASFTQKFSNISARSFYRWKKEWKDAIEILQANPGIDYERYKTIDSSVTEEVFEAWKQFLYGERGVSNIPTNDPMFPVEFRVDPVEDEYSVKKLSSKEFSHLQLHPGIDYYEFNKIFPYVPDDIFYQWKKEIDKIINYIRSQPSISFDEISAVLPDVTEEAFSIWKELIAEELLNATPVEKVKVVLENETDTKNEPPSVFNNNNAEAKERMTNALLHLMNNPNIEYKMFSSLFPFVSTETFDLWLQRIKTVILHVSSNATLDFEEFRSAFTDIGEDVFKKWKSLTPEQISAIGQQSIKLSASEVSENCPVNVLYQDKALYFCREHPTMTYDVFSSHYCDISETDFKCWMLKISTQISFINENRNLTFEDFSGIYPDVERSIFESWKNSSANVELSPHFLKPLQDDDALILRRCNDDLSEPVTNEQYDPSYFPNHNTDDSRLMSSELTVIKTSSQVQYPDNMYNNNQESSLTKLAKLTESNAPYYCGWNQRTGAQQGKDILHVSDVSNQSTDHSTDYNFDPTQSTNNNADSHKYVSSYLDHGKTNDSAPAALQKSFSPMPEGLHNTFTNCVEPCDSLPVTQENQSLSALMVMSADRQKFPSVISTPKAEKPIEDIAQSFPNQGKWKYDSSSPAHLKEEEEMFSSQRQKKISRAEYLFVKDNPDVDSQEFARIFPGVSARTFYRWKKEIKAQMQVA